MNDIEDLQAQVLTAIEERDTLINVLEGLIIHEAEADHAADIAYKRAYRDANLEKEKRTVALLEAIATLQCDEVLLEAKLAKARLTTAKDRLRTLDSKLSALQSLLAVRRVEMSAIHYGQHAGA